MRIGLLRHFPVEQQFPRGWLTAGDLQQWRERYDAAAATIGEFDLGGVAWQACVVSDMPRTRVTAAALFAGETQHTALLREAEFATFATGRLRLPTWGWRWALRYAWMTGHRSQRACRDEFRRRVAQAADELTAMEQDVLVVSHAGMMAYLSRELRRRGFAGPKLRVAKHAVAYVYNKR